MCGLQPKAFFNLGMGEHRADRASNPQTRPARLNASSAAALVDACFRVCEIFYYFLLGAPVTKSLSLSTLSIVFFHRGDDSTMASKQTGRVVIVLIMASLGLRFLEFGDGVARKSRKNEGTMVHKHQLSEVFSFGTMLRPINRREETTLYGPYYCCCYSNNSLARRLFFLSIVDTYHHVNTDTPETPLPSRLLHQDLS